MYRVTAAANTCVIMHVSTCRGSTSALWRTTTEGQTRPTGHAERPADHRLPRYRLSALILPPGGASRPRGTSLR
jgi:hypothetical protein